jgi:hypothetical protein
VLLLGAAVWQWLIPERLGLPWRDYNPWNFAEWARAGYTPALVTQLILTLVGVTISGAVVLWVLYAAATGRGIKQRLTDPPPEAPPEVPAAVEAAT